jgi:diguanylate cyclase (GGDEF)-like protein/PAS domain S-box-containing protein
MSYFKDPAIYRDILDCLQIGVSVLDLQKKIVFWSDGAEKVTGYARIEVLGHSCMENVLRHCNSSSCEMCTSECPFATALHHGRPVGSMGSIQHKLGYWAPVHIWAAPLRDEHGSIIGIIQTFESDFAIANPDPNDRSMKEHGCLDFATELPNQTMMQSHLRESLALFAELKIPFGVLCIEVQGMQQFRSRYGAGASASSFRALARTLRNSVWPADFVGRWKEDRFLLILSGCDQEALRAVGARMAKIAAKVTIEWWGEELSTMVMFASASAKSGDTVESLSRRIEEALQQKRSALPEQGVGATSSS